MLKKRNLNEMFIIYLVAIILTILFTFICMNTFFDLNEYIVIRWNFHSDAVSVVKPSEYLENASLFDIDWNGIKAS